MPQHGQIVAQQLQQYGVPTLALTSRTLAPCWSSKPLSSLRSVTASSLQRKECENHLETSMSDFEIRIAEAIRHSASMQPGHCRCRVHVQGWCRATYASSAVRGIGWLGRRLRRCLAVWLCLCAWRRSDAALPVKLDCAELLLRL